MPYVRRFEYGAITFTLLCLTASLHIHHCVCFKWSANICLTIMCELVCELCTEMWNSFFVVLCALQMLIESHATDRMGKFLLIALIYYSIFQWSTAVVQNATQFQHGSGSVSELQPLPCCLYLRRSSSVCSSASLLRTCCQSEQWVYTLWHWCTTSSMHVPCYTRFVFPPSSCDHLI